MNRVRAFFVDEAIECLDALRTELATPSPDADALYRAARQLRGSAQVARFGGIAREAASLERTLRPGRGGGGAGWGSDDASDGTARDRIEAMIASLETSVAAVRDGRIEQDEREPMTDEQTAGDVGGGAQTGGEVVPLDELEYRGDAALARAEALREPLEEAFIEGDPPGGILDELFDLIRLGKA